MRIPGISVIFPFNATMVVPHETMIEAGPSNVVGMEGGMARLRTLQVLAEERFGAVKEGQVDTSAIHLNSLQRVAEVGGLEMGDSPHRKTVDQDLRLEGVLGEDPNIGAPIRGSIDARERQPS